MSDLPISRRSRTLLLWLARLAFIVYVAQLAALDHWRARPEGVQGLESSAVHVQHCHGGPASCADGNGAGAVGLAAGAAALPLPPDPFPTAARSAAPAFLEPFLPPPDRPPRRA